MVRNLPAIQETRFPSLCQEDALEEKMTTVGLAIWSGQRPPKIDC